MHEQEIHEESPREEPEVKERAPIEEDWKDKYLRAIAEMENMRKRMQKEKQEMVRFGVENAVGEFLGAIDNFENALRFVEGASAEVKNWAMGFGMILSQFKEVIHNHGIVVFHSEGQFFNPDFHEAVETVENRDVPEGLILQEFSKGYKSGHRTLRPARVKVAKHPQKENHEPLNEI
jgi:molecular chaperone GrpE